MHKNQDKYLAMVCGNDLFALTTAILLQEGGVSTVLLQDKENPFPHPILWPSLNDPPTRAHAAHGNEVALYLSEFCSKGIQFLKSQPWAKDYLSPLQCFWRATKNFQNIELNIAFDLGLGLAKTSRDNVFCERSSGSVVLNPKGLWDSGINFFQELGGHVLKGEVSSFEETSQGVTVSFISSEDSQHVILKCELLVLGVGVKIGSLMTKFQSIAVPMLESYSIYTIPSQEKSVGYKSAIGHWWTASFGDNLWVSGPRFLLPLAGVGHSELPQNDTYLKKLQNYHLQTLFPLLGFQNPVWKRSFFSLSCWPCDELPVLGELGQWGRVIGTFGWLSVENSAGPWCAFLVSQLALKGYSTDYHPRLGKSRLMSQ